MWRSSDDPSRERAQDRIHEHFRIDHAATERIGVVFVAWSEQDDENGYYFGYWDGGRDLMLIEEMPEASSTESALEWARSRADRVRIRPSWDPTHYYSAGATRELRLPELKSLE
jgi:hypothetical protein